MQRQVGSGIPSRAQAELSLAHSTRRTPGAALILLLTEVFPPENINCSKLGITVLLAPEGLLLVSWLEQEKTPRVPQKFDWFIFINPQLLVSQVR